jgi:hypothetical protein
MTDYEFMKFMQVLIVSQKYEVPHVNVVAICRNLVLTLWRMKHFDVTTLFLLSDCSRFHAYCGKFFHRLS